MVECSRCSFNLVIYSLYFLLKTLGIPLYINSIISFVFMFALEFVNKPIEELIIMFERGTSLRRTLNEKVGGCYSRLDESMMSVIVLPSFFPKTIDFPHF